MLPTEIDLVTGLRFVRRNGRHVLEATWRRFDVNPNNGRVTATEAESGWQPVSHLDVATLADLLADRLVEEGVLAESERGAAVAQLEVGLAFNPAALSP